MDPFGNPLPSCSWQSPNWDFPGIEDTLAAMESLNTTPPLNQPPSVLTDSELLGILSENVLDEMDTDDDDCQIDLNELEEPVPLDTFNDEWQPGNPGQYSELPFTKTTGLQEYIADTPISYFNAICNEELLSLLTHSTNEYGEYERAASRSAQSRAKFWKPISCSDIKLFFGLLLHMGFIKINRLSDYWKTDSYFNQPIFAKAMSRNTFLLILRMLCVNIGGTTSHCKIKPIIDYFNRRMLEIYYPTKNIVIDESMMLWRGRLRFRQYMKGKKNKYGLKFYALADQLGVVLKLHLYGGASDTLVGGTNHVKKVVYHLMDAYINAGHHLVIDNFYTSVGLLEELYNKHTYCTGTLRKMRKGNPETLLKTKLKKGELCILHKNNICLIKWMDQREVLAISTKYNGNLESTRNRRGQMKLKPQIIKYYNQNMSAIDRHDQMLSYYSCEHKTLRWYKKVIIHIMQIITINSFFLYNKYSANNKMTLYDFRLNVIKSIIEPHLPPDLRIPLGTNVHCIMKLQKDTKGKTKRRRCVHCWTTKKKRVATLFACEKCPQQPGLCIECFKAYHKY